MVRKINQNTNYCLNIEIISSFIALGAACLDESIEADSLHKLIFNETQATEPLENTLPV